MSATVSFSRTRAVTAVRDFLRRHGVDVIRYPHFYSHQGQLKMMLARHGINMVLDVGANAGQFVHLLRGIGYQGWVASFEPVASLYEDLSKKTVRDPRWRSYQLALGDAEEERSVNVLSGSDFSSFLAPNAYGEQLFKEGSALQRTETVQVRTLDSVFTEVVAAAPMGGVFLKVDTQGWDLAVLRGAKGSCQRIALMQAELSVKPIYEAQPSWMEFVIAANEMGFELAGLHPVTQASSGAVIEFDGIFVRA